MARAYGQWAHGPDRRARCSRGCRPQRPSGPRDPDDRSRRHRVGDVAPAAQVRGCTGTCVSPPDCQASGRRLGRLPPVKCRRYRGCPPQSRRRYGRWFGESGYPRCAYKKLGRTRGRGAFPGAAGAATRLGAGGRAGRHLCHRQPRHVRDRRLYSDPPPSLPRCFGTGAHCRAPGRTRGPRGATGVDLFEPDG